MAKFYHIYLVPKEGIDSDKVKAKMDLALDWFKYGKSIWVIYSTSDLKKLMTRFKPLVDPRGNLFICELNISRRKGFMNKEFWSWLRKKR